MLPGIHRIVGCACAGFFAAVSTAFAQPADEERLLAYRRSLEQMTRRVDALDRLLSGAGDADSARRVRPRIEHAARRIEESMTEMGTLGPPSPDLEEALEPTIEECGRAHAELENAVRWVHRVTDSWAVLRDVPMLASYVAGWRHSCRVRLTVIGRRAAAYRDAHEGRLPPFGNPGFLKELEEVAIGENAPLQCPAVAVTRVGVHESEIDYATWWEATLPEDESGFPIAWDPVPGCHEGVRLVLLADGRIEELKEDEFEDLLDRWSRKGAKR